MPEFGSEAYQYDETIGDLLAYKNASFLALKDGRVNRSGERVIYCPDFNLIYSYMWERFNLPGHSNRYRDVFFDAVGQTTMSLIQTYRAQAGFTLAITDLTLLEVIESIKHKYDRFTSTLQRSSDADRLFTQVNGLLADFDQLMKINSSDAYSILKIITSSLPRGSIQDAAKRMSLLIETGSVSLLSKTIGIDALSRAASESRFERDDVVNRIRSERYRREDRQYDHSTFHYVVDAANLTLPIAVNRILERTTTAFVCKTDLRRFLSRKDDDPDSTRNPLVPFLKLVALSTSGIRSDIFNEADDWLMEVYEQARLRIDRLQRVRSLGELTERSQLYIDKFYTDYVRSALLHKEVKEEMAQERDRIATIVKNKGSLLEHFDAAGQDAKKGAEDVAAIRPEIRSRELLETYDLADNPHLQNVFETLGLKR